MYIKAYSEPITYSGIFKTAEVFSQFQTLLKSILCIFWTLFSQIQIYLELWLIQAHNVSRIFRQIHKVTYIEAYLPTLGHISAYSNIFRTLVLLIQITLSNTCSSSQVFLLNHSSNLFGTFFIFFKGKHSNVFSSG